MSKLYIGHKLTFLNKDTNTNEINPIHTTRCSINIIYMNNIIFDKEISVTSNHCS